jgi:hypothetical protein
MLFISYFRTFQPKLPIFHPRSEALFQGVNAKTPFHSGRTHFPLLDVLFSLSEGFLRQDMKLWCCKVTFLSP